MKKVSIGSDPELFVTKDGKISSFAGILGYDKHNKLETSLGVRLQEDNVLLEFDIDPCTSFNRFDYLMDKSIKLCESTAKERGFGIALGVSSHNYTAQEIRGFPDSAKEFGCSADLNALTGRTNPKPVPRKGLRTAGGHVHIGYFDSMGEDNPEILSASQNIAGVLCDYILGVPSLFEDPDCRRRELYGQAGAIRAKDYGIEYRTLSNYWISDYRKQIWSRVNKVASLVLNKDYQDVFNMIPPAEIHRVINENDLSMGEQYLKIIESI